MFLIGDSYYLIRDSSIYLLNAQTCQVLTCTIVWEIFLSDRRKILRIIFGFENSLPDVYGTSYEISVQISFPQCRVYNKDMNKIIRLYTVSLV